MKHKKYWYSVNKQNMNHHSLCMYKIRLERVSWYENKWLGNPLFFKTAPYFTNPSLFRGKIRNIPFWENFENSIPPL